MDGCCRLPRLSFIRTSSSSSQNNLAFCTPRKTPPFSPQNHLHRHRRYCFLLHALPPHARHHRCLAHFLVVETDTSFTKEEAGRILKECLSTNPCDTDALHTLMEVKIKPHKMDEVFGVLDRLIELEPEK
ncbi:hypothetical protein JHK87_003886 [Glycine soja]|nr:hypothetical protein JHK87_003886 [Glycine soja]